MTSHRVARRPTSLADYVQAEKPMGGMDYGTERVERQSEGRRLLKPFVLAVVYAALLWIAGSIALNVTGGEATSSTVPNPSQVVYVEGECLAY